jgi:hypothetical protein
VWSFPQGGHHACKVRPSALGQAISIGYFDLRQFTSFGGPLPFVTGAGSGSLLLRSITAPAPAGSRPQAASW